MTVTFAALQAARPELFGHASESWGSMSKNIDDKAAHYTRAVSGPLSHWGGVDAAAARQRVQDSLQRITVTSFYVQDVGILLADAAIGLAEAQRMLRDAVTQARQHNLTVDAQGMVHHANPGNGAPPLLPGAVGAPVGGLPDLFNANVIRVQNQIHTALALATEVDDKVSAGLKAALEFGPGDTGPWLKDKDKVLRTTMSILPDLLAKYGDRGKDGALRPWNIADAGIGDRLLHEEMKAIADGLNITGRPTAAILFKHWLEGSGTPQTVNVDQMLNDIPGFKSDVQAIADMYSGQGSFDSGWQNEPWLNDHRDTAAEQDWHYALNDFRFRVVGTSSMVNGHPTTQYTIEVYKNYQFELDHPALNIPVLDHVLGKISQRDLAHLHTVGLSRDFVVSGSTYVGR